jgi:hypothetical protein
MQALLEDKSLLYLETDKGLGPCAVTYDQYVEDSLINLRNQECYPQLSEEEARYAQLSEEEALLATDVLETDILNWLKKYKHCIEDMSRQYIENHMKKALGYTSDRVYRWRLLLEEFGPDIVRIKCVHNTVADAISRLNYVSSPDTNLNWMTFTKCWNFYSRETTAESPDYKDSLNFVFANTQEEENIYPLTIGKIAEAQSEDADRTRLVKADKYKKQLVEDIEVYCKDGKLVIPKHLHRRAVEWYQHYLQHPGSSRMQRTVRAYVKNCKKCQVNTRRQKQYGKLPPKQVITKPWHTLCVDLIGPYTIKGKDGTVIDFMCLTLIDPATSWFEIVKLPVLKRPDVSTAKSKGASRATRHLTKIHTLTNHRL